MSFADAKRENFSGVFLNTEHDAEEITYFPSVGGGARTITARVRYVKRESEHEDLRYEDERILVTLGRDPDAEKGGVLAPTIGDALTRSGDDGLRRFAFTGEIKHETRSSFTLEFSRPKPNALGSARREM